MACTAQTFSPRWREDVSVQLLSSSDPDETLATFLQIEQDGFAELDMPAGEITQEMVTAFRERLSHRTHRRALALVEGKPAAVATLSPIGEMAELAGVTTLPALRNRGAARVVSSFLVDHHFQSGGERVWLGAADTRARSVYEGIGFFTLDTRLNYWK
jgi:ribosomal protein S18 acetylase RimI-like enzyme